MKIHAGVLLSIVLFAALSSGCFLNVSSYRDNDGSLVYVGEVTNDGAPIVNPQVTGTFYDSNNNVIATKTGPACRVMPAHGIAAFKVILPPGTAQPARVQWKLDGTVVDNPGLANGLSAQLFGTGAGFPFGSGKPAHYGEMTNNSPNNYIGGHGCVAWLNASGDVIREATIQAAGLRFNPGDKLPAVAFENVPAQATSAIFFLDAGVTLPGTPPTTIIDVPLSAFTNTSQFPTPGAPFSFGFGEVHNTTSNTVLPEVIATTRDAAGQINGVGSSFGLCDVPAPPGGVTYAGYGFTSAAPAGTSPTLRIEAAVFDQPNSPRVLSVSGVTKSGGTPTTTITGTVTNSTAQAMTAVAVCAVEFDASGKVVSLYPGIATLPASGLAPGASATFSVPVPTFGAVSSVTAVAAGRPAH